MLLIKTTYPNKARECRKFIQGLVAGRFAACVNRVNGVKSYYLWEGKLQNSQEVILLIKTLPEKKEAVIAYIKKNHPYEVPEITIVQIDAQAESYENWMKEILLPAKK